MLYRMRGLDNAYDVVVVGCGPAGGAVVFDRRRLDSEIASLACEAGAELWVTADVCGMSRTASGWSVEVTHDGCPVRVMARIVVAADGVEPRVARWAGIRTALTGSDIESCFQYDLVGLNLHSEASCQFWVGSDVAPGGYAWVFPKSRNRANVDGRVPVAAPLKPPVAGGLIVVGDAARLANSVTGAGIYGAVVSGTLAGKTTAEACSEKNTSRRFLEALRAGGREGDRSQAQVAAYRKQALQMS